VDVAIPSERKALPHQAMQPAAHAVDRLNSIFIKEKELLNEQFFLLNPRGFRNNCPQFA
jgi:hypothetical protein